MIRALPEVFRTTRLIAQRVEERHLADLERHYADPAAVEWLAAPSGGDAPESDGSAGVKTEPAARIEPAAQTNPAAQTDPAARTNPAAQTDPAARIEPATFEDAGSWAEWIESFAAPHWQKHGYGLLALYAKQTGEAGATRPFSGLAGLLRMADPDTGSAALGGSADRTAERHTSSAAGVSDLPGGAPAHARVVQLVLALVPEAAGGSYAAEMGGALTGLALTSLDCESVNAVVRPDNDRALRVLEKLGFAEDSEHLRDGVSHVLLRRKR